MENSDSLTSEVSKINSEDVKVLLQNSSKLKEFITSCKDLMDNQEQKLHSQHQSFKEMLSNLESQHYNLRFHAVAIKLELESLKVFSLLKKKAHLLLTQAFLAYKENTKPGVLSNYPQIVLKNQVKTLLRNLNKSFQLRTLNAFKKWTKTLNSEEKVKTAIKALERENEELRTKKTQKSQEETAKTLSEVEKENQQLKLKIKQSEESVGKFVKEMGSLLDQHEPVGTKQTRRKSKVRVSPEPKRQLDKRKLQFD